MPFTIAPVLRSKRSRLAGEIRKGRRIEQQEKWEHRRGIDAYSRWLGVDVVKEAEKLATKHGRPIEVLDVGGGKGIAMAKLKKALGERVKETHVTTLTQPYPDLGIDRATRQMRHSPTPFRSIHKPTFHVCHAENIPVASASIHLALSVRGATWYTGRRLHNSVAEIIRTLRPGAIAFLHITEPNADMKQRIARLCKSERVTPHYRYGVVGIKRRGGRDIENTITVFGDKSARDDHTAKLRSFDEIVKYRVLHLKKAD